MRAFIGLLLHRLKLHSSYRALTLRPLSRSALVWPFMFYLPQRHGFISYDMKRLMIHCCRACAGSGAGPQWRSEAQGSIQGTPNVTAGYYTGPVTDLQPGHDWTRKFISSFYYLGKKGKESNLIWIMKGAWKTIFSFIVFGLICFCDFHLELIQCPNLYWTDSLCLHKMIWEVENCKGHFLNFNFSKVVFTTHC